MVERSYLPVWDGWDNHAPGTLVWLQAWFAMNNNGLGIPFAKEPEPDRRADVSIKAVSNPGWTVRIGLTTTAVEDRPLDRVEVQRSEHDWLHLWRDDTYFHAACGPLNLSEALHAFRVWVEGLPALAVPDNVLGEKPRTRR